MTSEKQIELVDIFFNERKQTLISKSKDYNGSDVLGIFKTIASTSNRTPELVILDEIHKKVLRLKNLLSNGKTPENESVIDSVKDLGGYNDLLFCAMNEVNGLVDSNNGIDWEKEYEAVLNKQKEEHTR